jgi:hypothetical protein
MPFRVGFTVAGLMLISLFTGGASARAAEPDRDDPNRGDQEKAGVLAVMQGVADAWNRGRILRTGYFDYSLTVIGDTPPYIFQGPHAVENWIEAYRNYRPKESEDAKPSLHLLQPQSVEIKGEYAYVAMPGDWTVEQNGQSNVSHGMITTVLDRTGPDWHVAAWVWTPR